MTKARELKIWGMLLIEAPKYRHDTYLCNLLSYLEYGNKITWDEYAEMKVLVFQKGFEHRTLQLNKSFDEIGGHALWIEGEKARTEFVELMIKELEV